MTLETSLSSPKKRKHRQEPLDSNQWVMGARNRHTPKSAARTTTTTTSAIPSTPTTTSTPRDPSRTEPFAGSRILGDEIEKNGRESVKSQRTNEVKRQLAALKKKQRSNDEDDYDSDITNSLRAIAQPSRIQRWCPLITAILLILYIFTL